jgi:protein SCO1/2
MKAIRRASNESTQAACAPAWTKREGARVLMCVFALLTSMALALMTARAVAADDPHGHRHHMLPETSRSVADYKVPAVRLVRDDGRSVLLAEELDDGRPVVLSFIYTSCTTICPITSQTLAELQKRLGSSREMVHIVSISIDPEQDTPGRLREYALKFGAGPEWQHYTGSLAGIVAIEQAFGVYHGDKMSHTPVTMLRTSPQGRWIRIDGFATPDQLLAELHPVVASR